MPPRGTCHIFLTFRSCPDADHLGLENLECREHPETFRSPWQATLWAWLSPPCHRRHHPAPTELEPRKLPRAPFRSVWDAVAPFPFFVSLCHRSVLFIPCSLTARSVKVSASLLSDLLYFSFPFSLTFVSLLSRLSLPASPSRSLSSLASASSPSCFHPAYLSPSSPFPPPPPLPASLPSPPASHSSMSSPFSLPILPFSITGLSELAQRTKLADRYPLFAHPHLFHFQRVTSAWLTPGPLPPKQHPTQLRIKSLPLPKS